MSNKAYSVGDLIVENGRLYKIFKIKEEKNGDEQKIRMIYFKPYFKSKTTDTLICSIPTESINGTQIRKPMDEDEASDILQKLSTKIRRNGSTNVSNLKEDLKENDIQTTTRVLRLLWADKLDENKNFTTSRRRVFKKAIRNLAEELAFARDMSLEEAKKKVKSSLKKAAKD